MILKTMKRWLVVLVLLWGSAPSFAQRTFNLYTDEIPNARHTNNEEYLKANAEVDSLAFKVSLPTISAFLPVKRTDQTGTSPAVIIFPGGGYGTLLIKREGSDVARAFNKIGVAAFVVKYRLPDDRTMIDKSIGPLQDAQQAMKVVRDSAIKWGIDPGKIGVMGFSAGGHLASTVGTHFDKLYIRHAEAYNLRPDFMLLINPVISFTDAIGHKGTRENLLGKKPSADQIEHYSNEQQVNAATPPAFLVHAGTDVVVPVANSLSMYHALQGHGVPAGLHIYSKGEHGFLTYPSFDEWFGRCINWMKQTKIIQ
jgi:acetyl esterase/lipase